MEIETHTDLVKLEAGDSSCSRLVQALTLHYKVLLPQCVHPGQDAGNITLSFTVRFMGVLLDTPSSDLFRALLASS